MNWPLLSRMLGSLGMLVGGSMVLALPWAFPAFGETETFELRGFLGLLGAIVCSVGLGGLLYFLGRKETGSILRKEALAIVGLGWLLSGVLGALPFLFSGTQRAPDVPMNVADALFESVSGFTTTGASVLTELEKPELVPRCILFWRCFTHWLGGMGIIVLFVAILGQLGAGGKALVRREVPGPINESVRPRVRETALLMWTIYVGISGLLAVLYMLQRMSPYDALCHTFGTMATGGFSTRNASIGAFSDTPLVEATTILFMLVAGTNFTLYYLCLRGTDTSGPWYTRFAPLFRDPEYRVYLGVVAVVTLLLTVNLTWLGQYAEEASTPLGAFGLSLRHALFVTVSVMTTTGFGTVDFTEWSEFAKGVLLALMFVGGCSGSTGGGVKVIRFILFFRVVRLEIERAYRPNVVRRMRVFGLPVDDGLRHDVVVYFAIVLFLLVAGWLTLAAIEPDSAWLGSGDTPPTVAEKLLDSASAVASCLNNIGPGLGVLGPHDNYAGFSPQGKLLLTLLMLLGRLELFAILVLFVPSFWRVQ